MPEPITAVWVIRNAQGVIVRVCEDAPSISKIAPRCTVELLPLATPEMVECAARWLYVRDNSSWERNPVTVGYDGDGNPLEEEWTFLSVRVPNGADLSCAPMRERAIDAARAAGGAHGA